MSYKLSFKYYTLWFNQVRLRVNELNAEAEFTTLKFYSLGFRGKKRRLCLIRNEDEVIACGIKQITEALYYIRGKKLWED